MVIGDSVIRLIRKTLYDSMKEPLFCSVHKSTDDLIWDFVDVSVRDSLMNSTLLWIWR